VSKAPVMAIMDRQCRVCQYDKWSEGEVFTCVSDQVFGPRIQAEDLWACLVLMFDLGH
jgi:hypothetical protein